MTVSELIARLSEMDLDAEVRIATQPSWPMQAAIHGVVSSTDLHPADLDDDDVEDLPNVVWIAEGGRTRDDSPYAPAALFDAL